MVHIPWQQEGLCPNRPPPFEVCSHFQSAICHQNNHPQFCLTDLLTHRLTNDNNKIQVINVSGASKCL